MHTQIPAEIMITISFILMAFIGEIWPCDQAWMNIQGEVGASNYFAKVLAEGVHCTRLMNGLFDETIHSFTMHYDWIGDVRIANSVTYFKGASFENLTPYTCHHTASTQSIMCERINLYMCSAIMTDAVCCSRSNAILWNKNNEFLYSSDFTNHSSRCINAPILLYFIFYELETRTSVNILSSTPSTPSTTSTTLTPLIQITSQAQDKDHTSSGLIVGLTLGAVLVIIIAIAVFVFWKKRKTINRATHVSSNTSTSSNAHQKSNIRLDNLYNNIPILRMLPLFKKKDGGKISNRCQGPKEQKEDHGKLKEENGITRKSEVLDKSRQSNEYDVYTCMDNECSKNLDDNLKCGQQYQCYQNNGESIKHIDDYQNIDQKDQRIPDYKTNDQTGKLNQDYETIDQICQQIQDHQISKQKGQQRSDHATINHDVMLSKTYTNTDQVDDKVYSTIYQQAEPSESELANETTDTPSSQAHVKTTPDARLGNKMPCLTTPCSGLLPDEISSPTYFVLESVAELGPYSMARPISSDDKI
ncbi:unnamed protein product [Lymnaea stagnalis]|uniref:Uncharacterized protein n=1 Tax=Lymnaea stagnalis TaxID=6523 RepID=A0AAV2I1R8_LYMST